MSNSITTAVMMIPVFISICRFVKRLILSLFHILTEPFYQNDENGKAMLSGGNEMPDSRTLRQMRSSANNARLSADWAVPTDCDEVC